MKAFMYKVLCLFRKLFLRLRVAVTLHIGHEDEKQTDESIDEEDSERSSQHDC